MMYKYKKKFNKYCHVYLGNMFHIKELFFLPKCMRIEYQRIKRFFVKQKINNNVHICIFMFLSAYVSFFLSMKIEKELKKLSFCCLFLWHGWPFEADATKGSVLFVNGSGSFIRPWKKHRKTDPVSIRPLIRP